ncbi:integrase family protein [Thioalkalivibrio sp. ALJ16]|uniref:integrase family protein n=1 Tax=Thioalkalivibrio sp. ALJ16 TaxID=1158762 RepID=UPI00037F9D22|nr:integrase family protein [Thioalkalivibrio sp. ALJ16]
MAAKALDTSITDAAARRFLESAEGRATLWCDRVTGLHLIRTAKGGSWRYRYTDPTGKRRTATIGRYPALKPQQAAEKALAWRTEGADVLAEKERRKREAREEKALAGTRTLRAYIEGPYARYQARRTAGGETLAILRTNFNHWYDRDLATLTRADVMAWQSWREGLGRAPATIKRAYGALRTLLRQAVRDGVIEDDPLRDVALDKPAETERTEALRERRAATRRLLTDDEIHRLHVGLDSFADELRQQRRNSRAHGKPELPDLDAVAYPHWFIPFAYLSLYTGLRPGDLYALTWLELNPAFGRLVKIPAKTRHHPEPARVEMDLPPGALDVVRAWWAQQGKPATGLVFPSPITGRRMDKKAHGKPWRRVKRLGGLPDDLTFYALRHHFISTLVAAGVPLLTVAKLAGHKSAAMIEGHYGHLCPDTAREIMRQYGQAVAPAGSGEANRERG